MVSTAALKNFINSQPPAPVGGGGVDASGEQAAAASVVVTAAGAAGAADAAAAAGARTRSTPSQEAMVEFYPLPEVVEDYIGNMASLKNTGNHIHGSATKGGNKTGRITTGAEWSFRPTGKALACVLRDHLMPVIGLTGLGPHVCKLVGIHNSLPNPPSPQFLHSDGATSVILPKSESGRRLDILCRNDGQWIRAQFHIQFGEAVVFTAPIFHAGAAGKNKNRDACFHFNMGVPANNNSFGKRYLYEFNDPEASKYMPPGVVNDSGSLDMPRLTPPRLEDSPELRKRMIGWYPDCREWNVTQEVTRADTLIGTLCECTYEEMNAFMVHKASSSSSSDTAGGFSSSGFSEFVDKRRGLRSLARGHITSVNNAKTAAAAGDEPSAYEKARLARIEQNKNELARLGLGRGLGGTGVSSTKFKKSGKKHRPSVSDSDYDPEEEEEEARLENAREKARRKKAREKARKKTRKKTHTMGTKKRKHSLARGDKTEFHVTQAFAARQGVPVELLCAVAHVGNIEVANKGSGKHKEFSSRFPMRARAKESAPKALAEVARALADELADELAGGPAGEVMTLLPEDFHEPYRSLAGHLFAKYKCRVIGNNRTEYNTGGAAAPGVCTDAQSLVRALVREEWPQANTRLASSSNSRRPPAKKPRVASRADVGRSARSVRGTSASGFALIPLSGDEGDGAAGAEELGAEE